MKRFSFLFPILFIAIGCGESGTPGDADISVTPPSDSTWCNCGALVFSEPYNHFYLTDKRKGFTGKCEEFYPSGQVKTEKNFKEGKLHGKMFTWYENGQLEEEKEFDMNFQTGEMIHYTSRGEVKFHALYKRGKQVSILVSRPELPDREDWPAN